MYCITVESNRPSPGAGSSDIQTQSYTPGCSHTTAAICLRPFFTPYAESHLPGHQHARHGRRFSAMKTEFQSELVAKPGSQPVRRNQFVRLPGLQLCRESCSCSGYGAACAASRPVRHLFTHRNYAKCKKSALRGRRGGRGVWTNGLLCGFHTDTEHAEFSVFVTVCTPACVHVWLLVCEPIAT